MTYNPTLYEAIFLCQFFDRELYEEQLKLLHPEFKEWNTPSCKGMSRDVVVLEEAAFLPDDLFLSDWVEIAQAIDLECYFWDVIGKTFHSSLFPTVKKKKKEERRHNRLFSYPSPTSGLKGISYDISCEGNWFCHTSCEGNWFCHTTRWIEDTHVYLKKMRE